MIFKRLIAAFALLTFASCNLPLEAPSSSSAGASFALNRFNDVQAGNLAELPSKIGELFKLPRNDAGYAFINHKLLSRSTAAGGGSWSNTKSCKYAGTATASAARTNWGQPAAWCLDPSTNAFTFSFWFKSNTGGANNADGALLTSAGTSGNSHFRTGTSGTAINSMYVGGQFIYTACSATITANTWTLVTFATTGSGGGFRVYVGNNSTSCIGSFSGVSTDVCTRDFLFNTLRDGTNTGVAFGEWGTPNLDEFTVWNTELSGSDHTALIDGSGHAIDPSTHSKAANLISYYRCGDDPTDSTTLLNDQIANVDGTHSGSDGVTYPSDVP